MKQATMAMEGDVSYLGITALVTVRVFICSFSVPCFVFCSFCCALLSSSGCLWELEFAWTLCILFLFDEELEGRSKLGMYKSSPAIHTESGF
jgi:hypothetical protein